MPILFQLSNSHSPLRSTQLVSTDIFCITDNLPENRNNLCRKFQLTLSFKHFSTLTTQDARFFILRVSDMTSGNLKASYSGLKSVHTDQLMIFEGASSDPSPAEETIFCDVITDELNSTLSSANYTVTSVECLSFVFIPYETSRKKMRLFPIGWGSGRRLQQAGSGNLRITYNVEAEYPIRSGQVDFMGGNFDDIIEVRIAFAYFPA